MADPVPATPATPSPVPVSVSAPASSQPPAAVLPAAEPAPAPALSAPAPVAPETAKPASPGEPAPQATTPAPPAPAPTLLEKFDQEKSDAEAAKVTAPAAGATGTASPQKPADQAKPAETKPEVTTPEPVEYKYTLPETIKMDDALKAEVHTAFDHFRANPAEGAQELVNLHDKQMRQFAEFMAQEQHRVFAETRQSWAKEVLSDPDIGGSGHQTAMGAIARMRDLLVPERDRPAFEQFLRVTGAGDHPQFLKLLHQAARYYDEPTLPPPNPRPPPGNGVRPGKRLRDTLYDHPRSQDGRS